MRASETLPPRRPSLRTRATRRPPRNRPQRAPAFVESSSQAPASTFHAEQQPVQRRRPPVGIAACNETTSRDRVALAKMEKAASAGLSAVIGETGFEPATARPPAGCATRLRHSPICPSSLERATGIEPALEAWKASVQPQHFARGGTRR